jgi:hypothetical protein
MPVVNNEIPASAILSILASRIQWGWACAHPRNIMFIHRTQSEAMDHLASVGSGRPGAGEVAPVLVLRSRLVASLVLDLTEDELAALGPCPNL